MNAAMTELPTAPAAPRAVTVSRTAYLPPMRAIDALCGVARRTGLPIGQLTVDSILDAARRKTGLTDFGEDSFMPRLHAAVGFADVAPFSHLGREIIRQIFITALTHRLRVEDYFRRHPDAADVQIERPVFILGFPRTGTTLLQNLLCLEDGARALKFWELSSPVPESDDPQVDRRIRMARARWTLRAAYLMAPEMRVVHEVTPQTPEECWPLFANTFAVLNWDLGAGLVPWGDWLLQQDMTQPYRYYKRQLQMMAHARPTRQFVLKCPEHLWFIDSLLRVFPDASLVWTHRDPVDVVASYCSLISLNRRVVHGRFDPVAVGQHITERLSSGVKRAIAVRRALPKDQIFDVDFRKLVADQAGTVHAIRESFGLPHQPGADDRVLAYLGNGRSDKRGAHVYDHAMYGLTPDSVYDAFAPYIDRFDIPLKYR